MKPWEIPNFGKTGLVGMGLLRSLGLARSVGDVEGLYALIVRHARSPEFYISCGVPDTVGGRFDMIALHAYIVLRRLNGLNERRHGNLGQALYDRMFADLDHNLREMGVGDLSVGRQIKDMTKLFYGRINAYDQALAGTAAALDDALTRNVYADVSPDPACVARLGRYLQGAVARSSDWTGDEIRRAKIAFPHLNEA